MEEEKEEPSLLWCESYTVWGAVLLSWFDSILSQSWCEGVRVSWCEGVSWYEMYSSTTIVRSKCHREDSDGCQTLCNNNCELLFMNFSDKHLSC